MDVTSTAIATPRRRWESISLMLTGWVPGNPGVLLRRFANRRLLAQFGRGVIIAPGVVLRGAAAIELGDGVQVGAGSLLNAVGAGSRLVVAARVQMRRDAWLDAGGPDNRIEIGAGAHVGWGVRLVSSGRRSRISIGPATFLDRGVDIRGHDDGVVEIGEQTYLGPYTCMAGPGPIRIGANCLIASHSSVYGNDHAFADRSRLIKDQGNVSNGVTIGDDCWLGSGVRVLDGVTIGDGCVVGAGAVVTRNLPAYSIAVGVPAKVIGERQVTG